MIRYDSIIIGAGLSGLAAGIRLSHFGKKVLIIEAHSRAGGLNSYYSRSGYSIDVGLHAMTNYCPAGTRDAPLTKLLRQLRIKHSELHLAEQRYSEIIFPDQELTFTNDITRLRQEIANKFPDSLAGFDRLRTEINNFDATAMSDNSENALAIVKKHLKDPQLIDMLVCPIMFYGNAKEHDMGWADFAIMWDSIFESGFSRPEKGMEHFINLLLDKYIANGGEIRFNTTAQRITQLAPAELELKLEDGENLSTTQIYSSARLVETYALCGIDRSTDIGKIAFSELILYLDTTPLDLNQEQSIIFFSRNKRFSYRQAEDLIDLTSGVICFPTNFNYTTPQHPGAVRISVKSSYNKWSKLSKSEYRQAKDDASNQLIDLLQEFIPDIRDHITFSDMFTPLTITRYAKHRGGAIYGSATKIRDAKLSIDGVYLIGTDQGFLGITGSLLSGISVVNRYGLH